MARYGSDDDLFAVDYTGTVHAPGMVKGINDDLPTEADRSKRPVPQLPKPARVEEEVLPSPGWFSGE